MSAVLYNPLDDFASYSIHYVMLACRTTESARDFVDEGKNADTLAAIEKVNRLGEAVPYGKKDTAFLVMDTRRFSQFSVENLKYEVLINGIEKGDSHGNLATTVNMTILDSVGISFINFLQWLMRDKMQTNFDGMIFMLRVIFVGHTSNGKETKTVQTITIPMHLFKLELNLDYAKGAYTAEFMPNINFDVRTHDRWLNISQASTFFTGKGVNTLGALINSFESRLNEESKKYYEKVQNIKGGNKPGRKVQYMITIPQEWENMEVLGANTGSATETIFKKLQEPKPGAPKDTNISVESGMNITDVLDFIFRQVKDISDLGAGRKVQGDGGYVTFYKHIVGISSDDETFVVHVDVVPFKVPNIFLDKKSNTNTVSDGSSEFYQQLADGRRVPKMYFELDYIYTGKNKDILNFDMKLQDLQWMLASNLEMGAGVMQEVTVAGKTETVNPQAELVTSRAFDPILLPKNTDEELRNFTNYSTLAQTRQGKEIISSQQDFTRNLSAFYAASPITTVVTIRGNPLIMSRFNMGAFLPHVSAITDTGAQGNSAVSTQAKSQYRKELISKILKQNELQTSSGTTKTIRQEGSTLVVNSLGNSGSYTTQPVFAKINIKGPDVDFITSELVNGEQFSTEILNDNYYVVFKVTNVIEGSSFRQELELYSHNIFGNGKITTNTTKKI